jgi:hypothetical protein
MITNISDLYSSTGGAIMLPTRAEKIVATGLLNVPVYTSLPQTAPIFENYETTAVEQSWSDYVTIRLAGRNPSMKGVYSPSDWATYWFLINPSEVQINRTTADEQAFTRGGWQIGMLGEDFVTITLNGKTPGKYFQYGTTDFYTPATLSYRNLLALELVVENNGYWFEGEQVRSSLTDMQIPKQIKMHADVELTVGEFVWYGMFETFEITEDADSPFMADFNLSFTAWKETFRNGTPYRNSIGGEVQRGHVPTRYSPAASLPTASSPYASTQNSGSSTNANTLISGDIMNPTNESFG